MQLSRKRFLLKLILKLQARKQTTNNILNSAGFTLLEILITLVIVGILFAISATSWTALLNNQRLNQANQKVYALLQETKTKAQKQNQSYFLRFRDNGGTLQYSITTKDRKTNSSNIDEIEWQNLFENKNDSVTLSFYSPNSIKIEELTIQAFDYQGTPPKNSNLDVGKRIIVSPKDGSSPRKCVIVQTLLGGLRNESDSVNKNAPKNQENFPCTTVEDLDENGNKIVKDISNDLQVLN